MSVHTLIENSYKFHGNDLQKKKKKRKLVDIKTPCMCIIAAKEFYESILNISLFLNVVLLKK